MNILFICNKSPWPPKEGGSIAMNALIEGLHDAGHKVKVIAINTNKYSTRLEDIPDAYKEKTNITFAFVDLSIRAIPAFLNLFTSRSYHVERFKNKDLEHLITKTLKKETFDIVQLETLFMSPYIPTIRKYSKAKIILRAHNIEHLIWERIAASTSNFLKKAYIKHLARTLKMYEINTLNKLDGIAAITAKDAEWFRKHSSKKVIAIPFGVPISKYPKNSFVPKEISLFHIGSMNWIPNDEGMRWFIDNVWSKVHANYPNLKLHLAGREMSDWLLRQSYPNVIVHGEVEDAAQFIRTHSIMIVPLLSGSGIRIKIIEAMTASKAVISTTIGAEGIQASHRKNILIADSADAFVKNISYLMQNPEKIKHIGRNARELIENEHSNEKLIERLSTFYRS